MLLLEGPAVVGHAFLELDQDGTAAQATFVCVARRCRGRGHGTALMAQLERVAEERGALVLRLECEPALQRFYAQCGYNVDGSCTAQGQVRMLKTLRA